jgi:ABC-type glycerol-3-phosphate transport system substrate-binding protein
MEWGMVPLPRDEQAATLGSVLAYAISSDTLHPQACWEWLMFLHEQLPPYTVPARRSLAESFLFEERVGKDMAAVARSAVENAIIAPDMPNELESHFGAFMTALEGMMSGDLPTVETMLELQQESTGP